MTRQLQDTTDRLAELRSDVAETCRRLARAGLVVGTAALATYGYGSAKTPGSA